MIIRDLIQHKPFHDSMAPGPHDSIACISPSCQRRAILQTFALLLACVVPMLGASHFLAASTRVGLCMWKQTVIASAPALLH